METMTKLLKKLEKKLLQLPTIETHDSLLEEIKEIMFSFKKKIELVQQHLINNNLASIANDPETYPAIYHAASIIIKKITKNGIIPTTKQIEMLIKYYKTAIEASDEEAIQVYEEHADSIVTGNIALKIKKIINKEAIIPSKKQVTIIIKYYLETPSLVEEMLSHIKSLYCLRTDYIDLIIYRNYAIETAIARAMTTALPTTNPPYHSSIEGNNNNPSIPYVHSSGEFPGWENEEEEEEEQIELPFAMAPNAENTNSTNNSNDPLLISSFPPININIDEWYIGRSSYEDDGRL